MENRHPMGCDPKSFRRTNAPVDPPIPRRRLPDRPRPINRHPSMLNGTSSNHHQASSHANSHPPLGRSSRDRHASPAYASLVRYPALDDHIVRLCRYTRLLTTSTPPDRLFDETVYALSTSFIEHVATERGSFIALQKRSQKAPFDVERTPVQVQRERREARPEYAVQRESLHKKRPRAVSNEYYSAKDSVPADHTTHAVPQRRSSLPSQLSARVNLEEDEIEAVPRSKIPRRAKDVDVLGTKYSEAPSYHLQKKIERDLKPLKEEPTKLGKVMKAELQDAQMTPIMVEEEDVGNDYSEEEDVMMKVVRPKQHVRDRSLTSDRMSLTPFIMDDDVETESEEKKNPDARKQVVRGRSSIQIDPSFPTGRSPQFMSAKPKGNRLRMDSVVIPERGLPSKHPRNDKSQPIRSYFVCKLPCLIGGLRHSPKMYPKLKPDESQYGIQKANHGGGVQPQDGGTVEQWNGDFLVVKAGLQRQFQEAVSQRKQGTSFSTVPRPEAHQNAYMADTHGSMDVRGGSLQNLSNAGCLPLHQNTNIQLYNSNGEKKSGLPQSRRYARPQMPKTLHYTERPIENGKIDMVRPGMSSQMRGHDIDRGTELNSNIGPRANARGAQYGARRIEDLNNVLLRHRASSIDSSMGTLDLQLQAIPEALRFNQGQQSSSYQLQNVHQNPSAPSPVTPDRNPYMSQVALSNLIQSQMQAQGWQMAQSTLHMNGETVPLRNTRTQVMSNGFPGLSAFQGPVMRGANTHPNHGQIIPVQNHSLANGVGHGRIPGAANTLIAQAPQFVFPNVALHPGGAPNVQDEVVGQGAQNIAPINIRGQNYHRVFEDVYRRTFAEREKEMARREERQEEGK